MAGLISDLGRGKAHRDPLSILTLSWSALCRDSGTSQYREGVEHPDPFHSGGSQILNALLQTSCCPVISSCSCLLASGTL